MIISYPTESSLTTSELPQTINSVLPMRRQHVQQVIGYLVDQWKQISAKGHAFVFLISIYSMYILRTHTYVCIQGVTCQGSPVARSSLYLKCKLALACA